MSTTPLKSKPIFKKRGNLKQVEGYQEAHAKFLRKCTKRRARMVKVLTNHLRPPACVDRMPEVETVSSMKDNPNKIPVFIKNRSIKDKLSAPFTFGTLCPFEVSPNWYATICNNRLTVYNDNYADGLQAPDFTFYNIGTLPVKTQLDIYGKYVNKKRRLTKCDWISNGKQTQVIVGDVQGNIHRLVLYTRTAVCQNVFDKPVKHIAVDYDTNVTACLNNEGNEIVFFTCKNLSCFDKLAEVGRISLKESAIEMVWIEGRLVCLTESDLIEVTTTGKKFSKAKKAVKNVEYKVLYEPSRDYKGKHAKFSYAGGKCVLIQLTTGVLEEHDLSNKSGEPVQVTRHPYLSAKRSFALHSTKSLLAISGEDGTVALVKYPMKKNRYVEQVIKRNTGKGSESCAMFWSKAFPDSLLQMGSCRIVRYAPRGSRMFSSKIINVKDYHDEKFDVKFDFHTMDYTNVDHDHRAYQWKWAVDDEISVSLNDRAKVQSERDQKAKKIKKRDVLIREKVNMYLEQNADPIESPMNSPQKRSQKDDGLREKKKTKKS